jgi:GNAT superfamily N-acetyltransferase
MEDKDMNKQHIIDLYDQDQRKDVVYPGMRREVTPDVVRHVETAPNGEGVVTYSQLTAANADAVIREQVRYFESIGQNFEWKLYDYDQPADLKERLGARGFTVEEAESIMVLDLQNAPQMLWQPVRLDVRRITDPEKLTDLLAVQEQVWEEDMSSLGDFLGEALSQYPDQMSVYIAYVDEQPASAAWIYFPQGSQFASLWGGSTLSQYRKRGLYTALLAVRAQEAQTRGVRFLTVDASPMSRPILEKHGFEKIADSYPCKWKCRS